MHHVRRLEPKRFRLRSSTVRKSCVVATSLTRGNWNMERRNFLKFAFGLAAGAGALAAASANAAPMLAPQSQMTGPRPEPELPAQPAVVDQSEVAQLAPEQVHWHGRGWHRGWHRPWHRRRRWHRHHW